MTPEELREQTEQLIAESVGLVRTATDYAVEASLAFASGNFPEHYKRMGQHAKQRIDDQYAETQRDEPGDPPGDAPG